MRQLLWKPAPILAALAAVGLALLVLLPVSGQNYDRTLGQTSSGGGLAVGVFADISDAQIEKNAGPNSYGVYVPVYPVPTTLIPGITNNDELTTNDPAYLGDPRVSPQHTYFGTTLYVSNDPAAFNTILITVDSSEVTANADGCAEATVRSGRGSITVQLPPTAITGGDDYYQAFVRILDPRAELPQGTPDYESSDGPPCTSTDTNVVHYGTGVEQGETPSLLARHGEAVTVSVQGAGQVSVRVDGEGPDLHDIKPEHEGAYRTSRVDFSFEVRDDDSGLRHDGELVVSADGDLRQFNGDRDHNTGGEPITVRSSGQVSVNGRSQDIDVQVWRSGTSASAPDITDIGRWTLQGDRPGVAYSFSAPGNNMDEGRYRMLVTARDRTGNETVSYAEFDDNDVGQPYTFWLDDTEPTVVQVWAGVGYDTREDKEVPDRSYIMVDFGEPLRPGIDPERFTVSGHQVVGIIHPGRVSGDDPAMDINDRPIDDPRSRVYLELARELESDETPDLLLFGGIVYDLAGNPNDSADVTTVIDSVAPRFAVGIAALAEGATLTGSPSTSAREEDDPRPVVDGRGEFVVDVRSDEELRRRPTVYFVGIETEEELDRNGRGTGDYLYSIRALETGSSLTEQEDPLHWRRAYKASGLSGLGAMIGVIVYVVDEERNAVSTPGWAPDTLQGGPPQVNDPLNIGAMHKAGLLVEVDTEFNGDATPDLRVTPRRGQENNETESSRPLIALRFPDEASEYALCPTSGCGGDNPDAEFSDSHASVRITEITLNGNDASARLSRVDDAQFAIQAGNLVQGRHEVTYTAVDEAGNKVEGEFRFSVLARGAYELKVSPGWNLISLPGTPADPSLSAVIPPFGNVSTVMAYQNGSWLTAAVDEDGEWHGSLDRIEAGYGYWVFANAFDTLAPLIPEIEPTSVPLTVRVTHGWNLVGVVDVFQNPAGTAPGAEGGGTGEADTYFSSIEWSVAYTFDPQYNRWNRISPEDDKGEEEDSDDPPEIANGRGYWVWSSEPGTLVP
ncbi:MAG: hypothetical protein OXL97_07585 [Chloroflexota bacterium]|nr:hypothetical protein [Chloroflexota bacterium]MDE2885640.1 hypothetical protein [Chloroflexota bacterium]